MKRIYQLTTVRPLFFDNNTLRDHKVLRLDDSGTYAQFSFGGFGGWQKESSGKWNIDDEGLQLTASLGKSLLYFLFTTSSEDGESIILLPAEIVRSQGDSIFEAGQEDWPASVSKTAFSSISQQTLSHMEKTIGIPPIGY